MDLVAMHLPAEIGPARNCVKRHALTEIRATRQCILLIASQIALVSASICSRSVTTSRRL